MDSSERSLEELRKLHQLTVSRFLVGIRSPHRLDAVTEEFNRAPIDNCIS